MLEASRMMEEKPRTYYAGSSECFGESTGTPANEKTPFRPRSPYAVAKSSAHWLVNNYREAYGIYACTGILFNHESPLRPSRFVTQKIISSAKKIANGSSDILMLGRLDISRDWGWAPEYVEAMWLMLQQDQAEDFVIATGETNSLEKFVDVTFSLMGLDWRNHVVKNSDLIRPTDLIISIGDASKAKEKLGWYASKKMNDIIREMILID